MKRILIAILVFIPSLASADKSFTSGKGSTWDCKKDPVVSIMHGRGVYTFKGACTSIHVAGGNNKLKIESVDELDLTGAKNDVTVGTVGTINLVGSKNKVTWKTAKTGDAPAINHVGKDNVVAQAGGGATQAPPATAAAAPKPATGGGSAIDCSKSPSFMYAENDGAFTFTGKCDAISISGNNNKLKIESVKTLSISGNDNTAEAAAVNTVNTSGNDNKVSYKGAVTANAKTKLLNTGNGNKLTTIK